MSREYFENRIKEVTENHKAVISRKNEKKFSINGVFNRYKYPALMREDIPLNWRFDYSYERNPKFLERIRVNAIMNAGAIYHEGKYLLVARVEGNDRKSYFAVAESDNGVDGFKFREKPITIPKVSEIDTNVYDMRLTKHEDGWIYGLFCSERKDFSVDDTSSAVAKCGIVRTKDFDSWERLPDLVSPNQQRNVCVHPEFVDGKYMLYTRPSDGFIDVGSGGGFPALPVAAALPQMTVTAIDSTEKKCNYIASCADIMGLTNVETAAVRAEEFARTDARESFGAVTARAVARLNVLMELCLPLVGIGGFFVSMKGATAEEEAAEAENAAKKLGAVLFDKVSYTLPGFADERTLLVYRRIAHTPDEYPRQYGRISKKPL